MKHELRDKIVREIENIGKIPRAIIKYGSVVSVLLFVGAAAVYAYNNYYINSFELMHNCIAMMKTSTTILAEIIIGSLIIDHISKNY